MRRRSDREKMRRRVGLHEFTLTAPVDAAASSEQIAAWLAQQAKRLHVPPGMTCQVEVLRYERKGRPVIRFSVRPRRDTSLASVARLLSETPERTP